MIAGLLRSNEGEISILGKNIKKHNRFAKMNIGIVPQDIAIYEELTAYENVCRVVRVTRSRTKS